MNSTIFHSSRNLPTPRAAAGTVLSSFESLAVVSDPGSWIIETESTLRLRKRRSAVPTHTARCWCCTVWARYVPLGYH